MSPANTHSYKSIQLLRFLASLLVVFFHVGILSDGYKGVDLFFIISGFVIYTSSSGKIGNGFSSAIKFFTKRLLRIFVPYWFVLLIIIISGYYQQISGNPSWQQLLQAIFLVPGHIPLFEVSWSLSYELYFYFLFALAIFMPLSPGKIKWIFAALFVTTSIHVIINFAGYSADNKAFNFFAGNNAWEFLLGIIAALFCTTYVKKINLLAIAIFVAAVAAFVCANMPYLNIKNHMLYGFLAFVIISIVVRIEDIKGVHIPYLLVLLGDASYITYLVHVPVREIFFSRFSVTITNKITYIALTLAVSVAIHLLFEKRVLNILNKKANSLPIS